MSQSSGFQGVDVSGVEKVIREFTNAAEKVDRTISYVQALIVVLRAAGFFTGGASVAYANYLQHTVLPWLRKVSMALQMAIQVLRTQLRDQEHASSLQTLGIEQLGYRTPELPTSDTRAFPMLELPGSTVPSGSGGAVAGAVALSGDAVTGGSLDRAPLTSLAPVTSPTLGGGAASGGVGSASQVTFPTGSGAPPLPAPGGGTGGVGGSIGGGVGSVGPIAGTVGGGLGGGGAGTVIGPTGAGSAGVTDVGSAAGYANGSSIGGGAPGATTGGVGPGVGPSADAGVGDIGGGGMRGGTGGGSLGADAGQAAIGATDGDPVVRSRDAITDQPKGFAGRASIGVSDVGEVAASPLRDEVVASGPGAGAIGAGLAAAGAIPLALKRNGQRLLGEDGEDLFGDGEDAGADR